MPEKAKNEDSNDVSLHFCVLEIRFHPFLEKWRELLVSMNKTCQKTLKFNCWGIN